MGNDKVFNYFGLRMSGPTWWNFRWDFLASCMYSFFNVMFNQFYMPLAIQYGAGKFQVGLLAAAPAIGLLLSPVWAGIIEKKNRPKPFVVWPNIVGRALIIVPAFYSVPWAFVSIAILFHMLMGIQAPAYASLVTRMYPPEQRGRLMGNVRVAMGLLMIPLAYVAGRWIDSSGATAPLTLGGVTGALAILAFARVRESEPVRQKPVKKTATFLEQLQLVKDNRALAVFLGATTLSGFGNMLASPLYSLIQVHDLALSNVQIGYIRMAYFTCLLISYMVMGWVIDRFSPKTAMCFGIAAYSTAPLLYGLIGNYPAAITAGGFQGIGDAIWDIGCMAYVFRVARGREAVVFGLHLMLFGFRGTIGPLLSTSLSGIASYSLILLAASLCSLLGLLLLSRAAMPRDEQGAV
ncbi:MFS transporter [Paenibacillus thalictri]|uniref:MFS transporter n=1 Tax=Paenibacillus thalictri TaxID=2527873 RepID=A0A4Q9DSG6_9BACL|nr:MFS transporter [Paenibacillus thalictri]TBL77825.1 MFS transporter [Paenibacillus thalictri]